MANQSQGKRPVIPFQFESQDIRVVLDEYGDPLFVGKDVCEALGYTNPNKSMGDHCKGVTKRYPLQTPGGVQELRVINEADMFRLVINSTLPSAQAFERLVFEEILPTIRRTGSYAAPVRAAQSVDQQLRAHQMRLRLIDRMKAETDPVTRAAVHEQLAAVSSLLGLSTPSIMPALKAAPLSRQDVDAAITAWFEQRYPIQED